MRRLVLLGLLALCGCGPEEEPAADGPPLEGTPWVLVSGIDVPGWETVAPSASLGRGVLGGTNGCNRYNAPATVDGDHLTLRPAAVTRMACGEPGEAVQAAFHAALEQVAGWRIAGRELALVDGDDRELLRFREATPVGTWEVTSFRQPGAVASPIEGTTLTAAFEDGGKLSGSAGCNDYSGTFTHGRGALTIKDVSATERACPTPAGVMEQEQQFLAALPLAAGYAVAGSSLTLLTREGTIVATLERAG